MSGSAPSRPAQAGDFIFGLGWAVLGAAIAMGSWNMDRLERQGVEPYAVPGLVPGLLGLILLAFGLVLAVRGWQGRSAEPAEAPPDEGAGDSQGQPQLWRTALALLLTLGFGVGLLGHGPPFWLCAFLFLFCAVVLFEFPERRANGTLLRGALIAAAFAAMFAAAVTLVFQEVFLVRLP